MLRGWKKLLHQGFFVRLEDFEHLGLCGEEVVEAGEAVDDALLLGFVFWSAELESADESLT